MSQPLKFFTYDIETLFNFFSFTGKFLDDPKIYSFEMSSRKNQKSELLSFLSYLQNSGAHLVGYNNLNFDWPIVQNLLNNPHTFTFETAYNLCQEIINGGTYGNSPHHINLSNRIIPQIDLMKLNHFDNANKRTRLKDLQFAMRSASVEDMPVKLGQPITHQQMDQVLSYNAHDVTETESFLTKCMKHIEIRKELLDNGVLSGDVLNFSDVKLGTEYLTKRIGRAKCFSGKNPKQTFRESIIFKDIILPKIYFRTEPFQEVLEWFKKQVIYVKSEEENPKLEAKLAGLDFHFGVGGLHGSVDSRMFCSNDTHTIVDVDVSGMYPAIAIANNFAPEHLGKDFTAAYKQLQIDRSQYKKGSTMNLILKLAGNGAFGNSDNPFSYLYDPKFPKEITINGQLQLLQLVESISLIPGCDTIQANTDGITVRIRRSQLHLLNLWKEHWQLESGLKLEEVTFDKFWIRDVNNYLAITSDGNIKAKGAYWFPKEESDYWGGSGSVWNKDFSMMVVQKVIEQTLINNWNPEALVRLMTDPFDFMLRYKVNSGSTVYLGDREMPKTIRYYVSKAGQPMKKVSDAKGPLGTFKRKNGISDAFFNEIQHSIAPGTHDERIHTKNRSVYESRTTEIEKGWLIKECNKASDFDWEDVDFDYYTQEINKLVI